MIALQAEQGIPIPPADSGSKPRVPYPAELPVRFKCSYPKLEPGESYFVPGLPKVIRNTVDHRARKVYDEIVVRNYNGPDEWGVRVWRIR